ncbi:MAG: DUF1493 family protein [Gallionella sp.]|jgi:acyl carrier protein
MQTIEQRVLKVISRETDCRIQQAHIKPEHELLHDLNLDSLDCTCLMMKLEEEFVISLVSNKFAELKTVEHVIDHIVNVCTVNNISRKAGAA